MNTVAPPERGPLPVRLYVVLDAAFRIAYSSRWPLDEDVLRALDDVRGCTLRKPDDERTVDQNWVCLRGGTAMRVFPLSGGRERYIGVSFEAYRERSDD